jgi:hypothetical protein
MGKIKLLLASLAALATAPACATANLGDTVYADWHNINAVYGNYYGNIHDAGHPMINGPASEISFNGTDTTQHTAFSALTFCVDIFHDIGTGNYVIDPLSQITSSVTKQKQLAALVTHASSAIAASSNKNATAVALQLAIWEVEYEAGTTGYTVASGNFYANGTSSPVNAFTGQQTEANKYLSYVTTGTWTASVNSARILYSSTNQSQIYAVPLSAIPEPSTWLTMILGFGLVGWLSRKRHATHRVTA